MKWQKKLNHEGDGLKYLRIQHSMTRSLMTLKWRDLEAGAYVL